MPGKKFILIVYDISDDKRRTKLHDLLLDYGTPVQYSVFECLLEARDEEKMVKSIRKIIRPRKDAVRYYYLCADCAAKTVITSGKELTRPPAGAIVIG